MQSYFEVIHSSYPLLDPTRFNGQEVHGPLLAVMYGLALPFSPAVTALKATDLTSFIFQALPIEARTPRLETLEAALLFLQRHTALHRVPTTPGLWPEIGSVW